MSNFDDIFKYVTDQLIAKDIKHQADRFPSGAIMLDISHHGHFYVIQFYSHLGVSYMGISEITEEDPGFSTVPTHAFTKEVEFKKMFEEIIS